MAKHELKVLPPYFDVIESGAKPFEVRRNDRAFQQGDHLELQEWHPPRYGDEDCWNCRNRSYIEHPTGRKVTRIVTFVYSGDPRFTGVEPGHVVLGLKERHRA